MAPVITAARRCRSFRPAQDLQRRTLAAERAMPARHGSDDCSGIDAGASFGGDERLPGVLGDMFCLCVCGFGLVVSVSFGGFFPAFPASIITGLAGL